jgi:hypothetical protein
MSFVCCDVDGLDFSTEDLLRNSNDQHNDKRSKRKEKQTTNGQGEKKSKRQTVKKREAKIKRQTRGKQ